MIKYKLLIFTLLFSCYFSVPICKVTKNMTQSELDNLDNNELCLNYKIIVVIEKEITTDKIFNSISEFNPISILFDASNNVVPEPDGGVRYIFEFDPYQFTTRELVNKIVKKDIVIDARVMGVAIGQ